MGRERIMTVRSKLEGRKGKGGKKKNVCTNCTDGERAGTSTQKLG